jgi:gliding motility-associated-like protein
MHILFLYTFLFICFNINSSAQNTFQKKLSSASYEEPKSFIENNSNFYFAGSYAEQATQRLYKSFLVKYDENINILWAKKLNTDNFSYNINNIILHQNYLYAIGDRHVFNTDNKFDAVVSKFDINGNLIWSKVLDLGINTQFKCIIFDEQKNKFIIAGTHAVNERTEKNLLIAELDVNGNVSLFKAINTASNKKVIEPTYIIKNGNKYQILAKSVSVDNPSVNYGLKIDLQDDYSNIEFSEIIIDDQFYPIKSFFHNNKNYVVGFSKHIFFVGRQGFWSNHVTVLEYENDVLIDSSFHILGNISSGSILENETEELMLISDVQLNANSLIISGSQNDNIFNLEYTFDERIIWAKYYGASATERLGYSQIKNDDIFTLSFTESFTPRSGDLYFAKTKLGADPNLANKECTDSLKYKKTIPFSFNIETGTMQSINLGGIYLENLPIHEAAIGFVTREFCYVEPPEVKISPDLDSLCINFNDPVPYFRVFDVGEYLPTKIYQWKYTSPSGQVVADSGSRNGNFRIPKYGTGSLESGLYIVSLKACIISELDSNLVCSETKDSIYIIPKRKPIIANLIEVCDSPSYKLSIPVRDFEIVQWSNGGNDSIQTFTQTGNYSIITKTRCGIDTTRFRIVFKICNTDLPIAQFDFDNEFACEDSCITLINNSVGATNYYWTFNGANIQNSRERNPKICFDNSGIFKIDLKVENSNGTDEISKTINVFSLPKVQLEDKYTFCEGSNITLSAPNGENYIWKLNELSNSFLFEEPGRYVVSNSNNCGTTLKHIQIIAEDCNCNVFVPNAFTPNSDGINDEIKVYSACFFDEFLFEIYDRWGEKVFETNNIDKSWDGIYRNQKMRNELYFYNLHFKDKLGKRNFRKGEINLIY